MAEQHDAKQTPVGLILGSIAVGVSVLALLAAVGSLVLQQVGGGTPFTVGTTENAGEEDSVPPAASRKYTGPTDLPSLVRAASSSVVWIYCNEGSGTGWIIDTAAVPNIRTNRSREFAAGDSALVVTAEHVIYDCIQEPDALEVFVGQSQVDASILNWHRKVDVALLAVNTSRPGLETTIAVPPASWAMSIGYPLEFQNPIPVVGRVIAEEGGTQYLDMAIQPGNSGSPVLNHRGQVIGTAVATLGEKDINMSLGWTVSVSNEVLCTKLFECSRTSINLTR
jgi:S1-C subfamily serine protease